MTYTVDSEQFAALLRGESIVPKFRNQPINLTSTSPQGEKYIHVKDIIVKGAVLIKDPLLMNVVFSGDSRLDKLVFTKTNKGKHIDIKGSTRINHLTLDKNNSFEQLIVDENANIESILIRKSQINYFSIIGNSNIANILFEEDSQVQILHLTDKSVIQSIQTLKNATIGAIRCYGKTRVHNLELDFDSSVNELSLYDEVILDSFSTNGNSSIEDLTTSHTVHVESMIFRNGKIGLLELQSESSVELIRIMGATICNQLRLSDESTLYDLEITDSCYINELLFEGGKILNKAIFYEWNTRDVSFKESGTTFPNKVLLKSVRVNNLRFDGFHINSTLQLTDVQTNGSKETSLELNRSSFNKLELIGNKLETFKKITFQNSDITNTFIAQTEFPNTVTAMKSSKTENQIQQKLFFEQIKVNHQRQGNRTEAIVYQAKELNAHYGILDWKNNFWDKLTLWFNKSTTNFGTSWTKGFLALFISTIPLFTLLLWSTKGVVAVWPWKMTSKDFGIYATQYFDFINPTSYIWKRWDFIYELEGGEIRWGVKLLLLFSKVLIVTIIYQIIQAFRKFGRK